MNIKKLFLAFFGLLIFAGCQPTLFDNFKDATCIPKRWTNEQCRAAFRRGTKLFFGKEKPDGKGELEVNYGVLEISEVDREVKNLREDLRVALDYGNRPERKFIDIHKLGPYLEHQEKVLEALDSSLQAVSLNEIFKASMGLSTNYSQYGYNGNPHGDSYDLKKIFGMKDIASAYPFSSDQIEEARKQGKLEIIESIEWKINRVLGRRIPDPHDPNDPKDENRFVWRPQFEWLSGTTYKIWDVKNDPEPKNSLGNYIEIFRMKQDGKKEQHPALKVFFPHGTETGVFVLDSDKEGDPGFGLPDFVETTRVSSLRDIAQNQTLLSRLFVEKDRQERIKPNPKPVFAEIVRVGQPMDMWEQASDSSGWKVAGLKYQNTLKNNYNVKINLSRDGKSTNNGQPPEIISSIEYIAKEWTGSDQYTPSTGQVVEYFKPKADFSSKNIVNARVSSRENPKRIVIEFEDGREDAGTVTAGSNKYIEDEPFAIEYTEGQTRWRIEKDQGSNVFNKKKQVAIP